MDQNNTAKFYVMVSTFTVRGPKLCFLKPCMKSTVTCLPMNQRMKYDSETPFVQLLNLANYNKEQLKIYKQDETSI